MGEDEQCKHTFCFFLMSMWKSIYHIKWYLQRCSKWRAVFSVFSELQS